MRQTMNISNNDMEDYNLALFTHAMKLLQRTCEFKEANSRVFFHKFIEQFVNRGLANTWEFAIHKIHESSTTTLCNSG
jgi:hypothetical protein